MDFSRSLFVNEQKIEDYDVIVVADLFVEDYVGGAELTTEALLSSRKETKILKLHSRDVTVEHLQRGATKYWIFGNFSQLSPSLIPVIANNLNYSNLEYDFKFCKHRSPEKHLVAEGKICDCEQSQLGKLIELFYSNSDHVFWMSDKQKDIYLEKFPQLKSATKHVTLSSVFDQETIDYLNQLRKDSVKSNKWIVLGSSSWIKGASIAEQWCKDNNKDYEVVWDLPYKQLLKKLSESQGFVYLPLGGDTCPRMVIEAKLLGCELHLNDYVLHKDESWFNKPIQQIATYLLDSPNIFWKHIDNKNSTRNTISGYVTTLNCLKQGYPIEACVRSVEQFCDQVVVVDGGSTDGTIEKLVELALPNAQNVLRKAYELVVSELKLGEQTLNEILTSMLFQSRTIDIKVVKRDWNHPRSAVFDGLQKAEARSLCKNNFCFQIDSDEVIHEDDAIKIKELISTIPKSIKVLSLPVIEYWGGKDKIRVDVPPWKWRISRNDPDITHGIPIQHRRYDDQGNVYAVGNDGCDYISKTTGERIHHMCFYTPEVENVRQFALNGHNDALKAYQNWFNQVAVSLPVVFHYSWYDLERKIKLYRDYWTRHWHILAGGTYEDTAETNMMFDMPWKDVTDEMITAFAKTLKNSTGGHVWHRKWDGKQTPHITVNRTQPKWVKGIYE